MSYTKPVVVAQNNKTGVFAAGCPAKDNCHGGLMLTQGSGCKACERSK